LEIIACADEHLSKCKFKVLLDNKMSPPPVRRLADGSPPPVGGQEGRVGLNPEYADLGMQGSGRGWLSFITISISDNN
jgi:hypothetical protein